MINLIEIYTNKYRNRPATNSAQAQPEKGVRLCAERYSKCMCSLGRLKLSEIESSLT